MLFLRKERMLTFLYWEWKQLIILSAALREEDKQIFLARIRKKAEDLEKKFMQQLCSEFCERHSQRQSLT